MEEFGSSITEIPYILHRVNKAAQNTGNKTKTHSFFILWGSFFNRQASVMVTLRRMPHPISSPADSANMVKGIPIRQNMIVMPCPSRVFGVRFANPEKKQYSVK